MTKERPNLSADNKDRPTDDSARRPAIAPLRDPIFLAILAATLACRVYLVTASGYIYDEEKTWIPAAEQISFQPGALNLPIRSVQHPALPAYLMKLSTALFGTSPFGYRFPNLVAGLVSVVVIYRLGSRWGGTAAGRWAALLLAFNEYHLAMHSVATEEGLYLCCALLSLWAFTRFLDSEHAGWLFAAAACLGVGFLCSEISALLLPVYFISLLVLPHRRWLRRPQPWLAALLFFVIIAPDVWYNFATPPESVPQPYANYADHLSRIGGVGLSEQPLVFYFRYAMERLHIPHENTFNEMPSMNPIFGAVLLGAVVLATFWRGKKDPTTVTLLIMFWFVFVFFSLISAKPPSREGVLLDPVSWIWVDTNLFPAALLAAGLLARLRGRWLAVACSVAAVLLIYVDYQVATLQIWWFAPAQPAAEHAPVASEQPIELIRHRADPRPTGGRNQRPPADHTIGFANGFHRLDHGPVGPDSVQRAADLFVRKTVNRRVEVAG